MGKDDNISSCAIRIDKEGVWYYKGVEMTRKDIVNHFYQNLKRDQTGRCLIELENERCYLDVEDTPFVVKAAHRSVPEGNREESILLLLSDDTVEKLDPLSLWIGSDNVLYCAVKNHQFDARFSRAGYYQLAGDIEYDGQKDAYFISVNGCRYYINNKSPVN